MKKECLLIDDDQDDQEIFLMALRQLDPEINCVAADDCVRTIAQLKANSSKALDYIFLDINMPKMSGLQCLEEIRKIVRLQNVKIVMYSTTVDDRVKEQAKGLGANGFLVKPPSVNRLINSLAAIFNNEK